MGPKLKENPHEWLKFIAGLAFAALLVTVLLYRARRIGAPTIWWCVAIIAAAFLLALLKPVLARPVYRAGMTLGFYVGQIVSRVLLSLMFLVIVTPLGFLMRLFGKDLLALRRRPSAATYWQDVKTKSDLKRQF
jgi:Saxitoxin biosynthesis operon protein SxtJ